MPRGLKRGMYEHFLVINRETSAGGVVHGRPQKFFQGGQRQHFVYHFQIADDQCPSKIILHWASICFSENDYFRAE